MKNKTILAILAAFVLLTMTACTPSLTQKNSGSGIIVNSEGNEVQGLTESESDTDETENETDDTVEEEPGEDFTEPS